MTRGGVPQDDETALWDEPRRRAGDACSTQSGKHGVKGAVSRDDETALQWRCRAAEQGTPAQRNLGKHVCCWRGAQDDETALQ
ncbi:MAG: hypothetical protein ACYYK0_01660 [Candidatus Eutrophobiaceae bacterium]